MAFASKEYSPLYHLATIVCPPWMDREKVLFVMLTFAFDAAGDESTEYLTVAGFASSMADWDGFTDKWQSRLQRDNIEFFRAVDANSFRGPFKHWRDLPERNQLRRALFADLMDLIKSHAYRKFGCTIHNKQFRSSNNEARSNFVESAYSLAARTCEKYARTWVIQDWKSSPDLPVAFVFEAGDPGQARLRERLVKDAGRIPPTFRPKLDVVRLDGMIERGFVPLQAADWLAWELNRASRDADSGAIKSENELRWPMQEFLGKPAGYLGFYSADDLANLDNMIALENAIVSWEKSVGLDKKVHSA